MPLGWDQTVLAEALRGVGINGAVTVVDQTPGRPWLVRIVHPTNTEDLAFHVEVPRAEKEGKFFKLRFERLVGRSRQDLESRALATPRKPRVSQQPPIGADAGMDVDDDAEDDDGDQDADQEMKAVGSAAPEAGTAVFGPPTANGAAEPAASATTGGNGSKKQTAKTPASGAQAKKAKVPIAEGKGQWWDVRECGGGGCCFYNSFAAAYALQKDKKTWEEIAPVMRSRGRTIRGEIAEFISKRPEKYREYFAPDDDDGLDEETRARLEDGCTPETWEGYLAALRRPARYVDELSFRACCARFRSRVVIFIDEVSPSAQRVVYGQQNGSCTGYLLYTGRHYQLVQPRSGIDLPGWVQAIKNSDDLGLFPRGGGKGAPSSVADGWAPSVYQSSCGEQWAPSLYASSARSAGSARTLGVVSKARSTVSGASKRKASPARSPHASSGVVSKKRKVSQGAAAQGSVSAVRAPTPYVSSVTSGRGGSAGRLSAKAPSKASGAAAPASAVKASVAKDSQDSASEFTWPCEHCGFIARGSSSRSVTLLKYKHLARHHKHVPTRTRRREAPWTEAVVGELPPGGWQCGFCFKVLPRLSTNERTRSIGRHLSEAHPGRSVRETNQAWLNAKGALVTAKRSAAGSSKCAVSCSRAEVPLRQLRSQGHDPVYIGVDPGCKGKSFWTCRKCTGYYQGISVLKRVASAGRACLGGGMRQTLCRRKSRLRMWKFCSPARRTALSQAWGLDAQARRKLTVAAAELGKAKARRKLPVSSSKCRKVQGGASGGSDWVRRKGPGTWERDLTQDGDVESNPGPLSVSHFAWLSGCLFGLGPLGPRLGGHVGPLLWVRDLVCEGVEPHPGPHGLKMCTLNVNGASAAFVALRAYAPMCIDIMVMQETHLADHQLASFTAEGKRQGYRVWSVPAKVGLDSLRRRTINGGLICAVKEGLPAYLVSSVSEDAGEALVLQCGQWRVCGLWQRPGLVSAGGLTQHLLDAASAGYGTLALGDFNHLPSEGPLVAAGCATAFAATEQGGYVPTRWRSQRCIDFLQLVEPQGFSSLSEGCAGVRVRSCVDDLAISDHRAAFFEVPLALRPTAAKSLLRPCQAFRCPAEVPLQVWRQAVQRAYGQARPFAALHTQEDVDAAWHDWCRRLERSFRQAAAGLEVCQDPRTFRAKGSTAERVEGGDVGTALQAGSFRVRRLGKLVGRLRERARRGANCPAGLHRKIAGSWPAFLPWVADPQVQLQQAEAALQQLLHAEEQKRLQVWRSKLRGSEGACREWVKRSAAPVAQTVTDGSETASTDQGAVGLLSAFWDHIWQRRRPPEGHVYDEWRRAWDEAPSRCSGFLSPPLSWFLLLAPLLGRRRDPPGGGQKSFAMLPFPRTRTWPPCSTRPRSMDSSLAFGKSRFRFTCLRSLAPPLTLRSFGRSRCSVRCGAWWARPS